MRFQYSLKRRLLIHELALLLLALVTAALAGSWGYAWRWTSRKWTRLNAPVYQVGQVRSDLFLQVKEVTEA